MDEKEEKEIILVNNPLLSFLIQVQCVSSSEPDPVTILPMDGHLDRSESSGEEFAEDYCGEGDFNCFRLQ